MRAELRIPTVDRVALQRVRSGFARFGFPFQERQKHDGTWFRVRVPNTHPALDSALTVLQGVSELQLARTQLAGLPAQPLYGAGIVYKREPPGREWWQTALDNLVEGEGDCEDLASHRAAELVVFTGEPARAVTVRTGKHTFHAVVLRADGSLEDPSAALGMRGKDGT
jgi:hypothetical protein